jgi:hypothetical protein
VNRILLETKSELNVFQSPDSIIDDIYDFTPSSTMTLKGHRQTISDVLRRDLDEDCKAEDDKEKRDRKGNEKNKPSSLHPIPSVEPLFDETPSASRIRSTPSLLQGIVPKPSLEGLSNPDEPPGNTPRFRRPSPSLISTVRTGAGTLLADSKPPLVHKSTDSGLSTLLSIPEFEIDASTPTRSPMPRSQGAPRSSLHPLSKSLDNICESPSADLNSPTSIEGVVPKRPSPPPGQPSLLRKHIHPSNSSPALSQTSRSMGRPVHGRIFSPAQRTPSAQGSSPPSHRITLRRTSGCSKEYMSCLLRIANQRKRRRNKRVGKYTPIYESIVETSQVNLGIPSWWPQHYSLNYMSPQKSPAPPSSEYVEWLTFQIHECQNMQTSDDEKGEAFGEREIEADAPSELFRAIGSYDTKLLKLLIETQTHLIHGRDRNGNTPLMLATVVGWRKAIKLLIKQGVDINASNRFGNTCSHFANALPDCEDMERYFRRKNAATHLLNERGISATHFVKGQIRTGNGLASEEQDDHPHS